MVSSRLLHSHLKVLSNNDLKETRTEEGFKQEFATLFDQDVQTLKGTMLLNLDQLEKHLDKEEFQENRSMVAFRRERLNERQIQTKEGKVDTSKGMDASLAVAESSGTNSRKQDTSSKSGNDIDAVDADIKPIYDEELLAKVDQDAKQCHDKRLLTTSLTNSKTTKLSNQFLESENSRLKKTVAQYQHDFSKLEAHCINLELQLQNNFLKPGKHGQFLKAKSNESKV
ncbi:hypothetical protein Tco_1480055 [Tanacetum coccineum]